MALASVLIWPRGRGGPRWPLASQFPVLSSSSHSHISVFVHPCPTRAGLSSLLSRMIIIPSHVSRDCSLALHEDSTTLTYIVRIIIG